MKKISSFLISLLLLCAVLFPSSAFAQDNAPQKPYVYDEADVLTDDEEAELTLALEKIRNKYDFDAAIAAVNTLDGMDATDYADDYFDYNGFGKGDDGSGILFLVSMEPRQWAISTKGYGIEAFTPVGQEYMADKFLPYLKSDDYSGAFKEFTFLCDDFLNEAAVNKPYDNDNNPNGNEKRPLSTYLLWLLFSIGAGFLISWFIAKTLKSKLKTAVPQPCARDYLRENSLNMTRQNEILVNTFITRQHIERQKSNSSGSDSHRSSSGSTHGGSSGSY